MRTVIRNPIRTGELENAAPEVSIEQWLRRKCWHSASFNLGVFDMRQVFLGAFLFLVSGYCLACSCSPFPAAITESASLAERDWIRGQWERRLSVAPNVFAGVVQNVGGAGVKGEALRIDSIRGVFGKVPDDGMVYNDANCPKTLQVGKQYIFFSTPAMAVSMCTVVEYSESQLDSIRRALTSRSIEPPAASANRQR